MKKFFMLLLCLFAGDSFASGIASNSNTAPCTNNTLETYSGNSNLSADWAPNEIQLRWYNNNTLLDVQTAANTCTYDDTLTIPSTAPTRTGYTFDGWTVIPEIDFSTLPTNEIASEGYGWGINGWCIYDNDRVTTPDGYGYGSGLYKTMEEYKDLNIGEWKTVFSWGTIYGMSMCSSTQGTTAGEIGNPVEQANGLYCWCKATGYVPSGTSIKYGPTSSGWVYNSLCNISGTNTSMCNSVCAGRCATFGMSRSYMPAFFQALFQPVTQ